MSITILLCDKFTKIIVNSLHLYYICRVKVVIDSAIPFIKGVLEPFAQVVYLEGDAIGSADVADARSEERRVGKECRSRWSPYN